MPKLSVIIPCYNQGQYLDEAVDSVLKQTFQDFEIVIVNDGSTDDFTNNLLKDYNKPKTKIIETSNQGLSAARNNAIKKSVGQYILPLDADDKIADTFLDKTLKKIEEQPNIKAVGAFVYLFGETESKAQPQGGQVSDFLHYNRATATALYRKLDWELCGGYDETMKNGYEDWDFWIRMLKDGSRLEVIPEYLFYYRQKKESMLVETHKKHMKVYKKLIEKNIDIYIKHCMDVVLQKEEIVYKQKNIIHNLDFEVTVLKKQIANNKLLKLDRFFRRIFR